MKNAMAGNEPQTSIERRFLQSSRETYQDLPILGFGSASKTAAARWLPGNPQPTPAEFRRGRAAFNEPSGGSSFVDP